MGAPVERDEVERTGQLAAAPWYTREVFQRSLLALAGALAAVSVAWMFRVNIAFFVASPTLDALKQALRVDGLGESLRADRPLSHALMLKAAVVGGLVFCFPWVAYQAFRYAAGRAAPDGTGGIGRFVGVSTLIAWGCAWLVPNLLSPPLLMRPRFDFDMEAQLPADFLIFEVFDRVCGA